MVTPGVIEDALLAEKFRDEASTLIQNTSKGEAKLDANVGPQIWLENKDFLIRTTLWSPENKKPLSINLNTASEYDLASFPKIGLDKAKELIKKRDELGYFTSLQQAKKLGFQEGLADITPTPRLCLTSFLVINYSSSRCFEGRIKAKMQPQPAEPKTKLL